MEKSIQESLFRPLPTVEELQNALKESESGPVRQMLARLFDENTFVELGVYAKRSFCEYAYTGKTNDYEGVICGYGAIGGSLAFVFAQDLSRMKGAVDASHARKIARLYDLALENGAPVIGIFNSAGADIYEGVSALAAYGSILRTVAGASGKIPQLALVNGLCIGSSAAIAALFDHTVFVDGSSFYVMSDPSGDTGENNESVFAARVPTAEEGLDFLRGLLYYLPPRAGDGVFPEESSDDMNRLLGDLDLTQDPHELLCAVADNGVYLELYRNYAYELICAFTQIGGVRCGVLSLSSATGGHLTAAATGKAAHFISFCDAFSLPIVFFVDSQGIAPCIPGENAPFAKELARLARAYATAKTPRVTVVLGHAIGGAFTMLGSKALGADMAFALDTSEIGALLSGASVAFAWNDRITPDTSREELEEQWRRSMASPVAAAAAGEIDDIITVNELRTRLCTSLQMLCAGGSARASRTGCDR